MALTAEEKRARRAVARAAAGGHPKPSGNSPRGCYWDGHTEPAGVWRRHDTNEIYDPQYAERQRAASHRRTTPAARARHAEQQARAHAARVRQSRNRRYMAARCNDTMFKAGFNLAPLTYAATDVGTLYDAQCDLVCGA